MGSVPVQICTFLLERVLYYLLAQIYYCVFDIIAYFFKFQFLRLVGENIQLWLLMCVFSQQC